ncbi:translation initiation factor IF-2-like [Lutra lutra]|uniref:translation initiation factor IF-2-like n=1 Tax=Lutra lutra TaxID=9657 RepID=UPI001FD0B4B4|nr:translation initiation factor IF-2-like [Lutra lutra]XP_047582257.1 translation initiation factor IF-2-like [Lutra lutra]
MGRVGRAAGVERSRGGCRGANSFSSLGNREARRRGQDGGDPDRPKPGPRKRRFAAEAASRAPRAGSAAPEPAPARFPGRRRGPRAEGAGARAGTAAATPLRPLATRRGWGGADSARRPRRGSPGPYFRLEAPGFQRRRAPAPAGRLALSDGDAAVRVGEVCAEARNLPGRRRLPARPRAAPRPRLLGACAGVAPGAQAGRPLGAGSLINLRSGSSLVSQA